MSHLSEQCPGPGQGHLTQELGDKLKQGRQQKFQKFVPVHYCPPALWNLDQGMFSCQKGS